MTQTLIRPTAPVEKPIPVPALEYRPALDGLRGIAVLAVIAYHLDVPGFRGGFLGVDLFFVLSGALITALLLLEHDAHGRIDVPRFWARRARRLVPAVLLLLAVVVPLARADIGIRGDALATLGYVANWRFAAQARSYFAEAAAMSPLNHMWSLAIEEQFYILWPVLMGMLAPARRRLVAVLVGLTALSAVCLAWLFATSNPSIAYYHTLARIHEVVIGALTAVAMLRTTPRMRRLRALATAWLVPAVVVIGAAITMMGEAAPVYYLGGSVVFSIVVGVVILGLEDERATRMRALLSWRPLVTVGTLSYGLYLWHWPFVVLFRRLELDGPALGVAVATMTAVAAVVSSRLVELPIRAGRLWRFELTTRRSLLSSLLVLALGAGAVIAATPAGLAPEWTQAVAGEPTVIVAAPAAHSTRDLRSDRAAIDRDARSATGAPGPADDRGPNPTRDPLVIGVVGDSAAASMLPGIAAAAERHGDEVVSVAARGCPMVPVWQLDETGHSLNYSQDCRRHVQTAFTELVERHDPDLVLWYSGRDTQTRFMVDGRMAAPGEVHHTAAVRSGFEQAVERLTAKGADLVIMRSLPRHGSEVTDCDRPPGPGVHWCDDVDRYIGPTGQNALYEELAQRNPEITLISQAGLVCGSGPVCDDAMTTFERWRSDLTHFGGRGALRIGEAIITDALAESGNY
ncbi:MAG: acyltransferase [Actinobacteria bacterium]|nr:acyltransferase [Actinomycetota bacterium]